MNRQKVQKYIKKEDSKRKIYFKGNENCEECGGNDVITLHDNEGSYEHCNECGHDERN